MIDPRGQHSLLSALENKKHILFISSWYPSEKQPAMGIFNRYFAEAAARFNQVSVIVPSAQSGFVAEPSVDRNNGILTVTVPYRKPPAIPLLSQLIQLRRIRKAFFKGYEIVLRESGTPRLLQINVVWPLGVPAMVLVRRFRLPYVVNENWSGYAPEDNRYRNPIQIFFTKRIIKGASRIMPTSSYLAGAMQKRGLQGKYKVVPNVVNTKVFRPMAIEPAAGSTLRFIHISSLNDREKNVSGLLRAFKSAVDHGGNLELVVVGEGSDRQKYEDFVKSHGLSSRVFFKGHLPAPALAREINHTHALVMFSYFETFCLVVAETLACGKPVISSRAGAIPGYLRHDMGILVDVAEEEQLAKAFLDFRNRINEFKPDLIRQYAEDNFSYETVGRQLDKIYTEVLVEKNKAH